MWLHNNIYSKLTYPCHMPVHKMIKTTEAVLFIFFWIALSLFGEGHFCGHGEVVVKDKNGTVIKTKEKRKLTASSAIEYIDRSIN